MNRSASLRDRPRWLFPRRLGPMVLAAGLTLGAILGLGAAPAGAATVCTGDTCVVLPDSVQTPLGPVTVTVSATNVVTARLDPVSPNTWVVGVPFTLPPGALVSSCPGGCSRTTIDTTGGVVTIDTIQFAPGPASRFSLPNLAIISIHPPNPCRATTHGTIVTFTPISPPGPPN
jgi:hypothetical protein